MTAIAEAKQAARDLVRRAGVSRPPVDVESIIQGLGIDLVLEPLDDELSGMALINGRRKVIIVNSRHAETRCRFTMAHECGHHVLHEEYLRLGVHVDKGVLRRDSLSASGRDLKEISANAFAAELLMPRSLIRALVPRDFDVLSDDRELESIAKRFNVSPAALSIRLINLS